MNPLTVKGFSGSIHCDGDTDGVLRSDDATAFDATYTTAFDE
jgi:hypothetical protein